MIRIRVAILDADETYSFRLTNAFNTYYQDKLEVYSFSEKEISVLKMSSTCKETFLFKKNERKTPFEDEFPL